MQRSEDTSMRLNKFLATAGVTSRRKADEMIEEGKVKVNGKTVTSLGSKIDPAKDKVFINQKEVTILDEPVYIVFNKPKDVITTAKDERGRTTVLDFVRLKHRVYPIGRLDRNTTGVLLLTNDGDLAHRLMHPRHGVKKAYKVTLDKPLTPQHREQLSKGIRLSDGKTAPAEIYIIPEGKNKVIGIVIHEGRNRQVHRMFEALGYLVEKLDRGAYADITYDGVPRGKWRMLTRAEVLKLKKLPATDHP